jgi:hypothetical protein
MGGSSAPKNTTTTTVNAPPAWLASAETNYLNQVKAANSTPYQSYNGQLNAAPTSQQAQASQLASMGASGLTAQQLGAYNTYSALAGGSQNVNPDANPYLGATNPYAGPNSFLTSLVSDANNNITDSYNQNQVPQLAAQFATGGAFGGSAMAQAGQQSQDTLAKNLAQSTDNLRFQDYTAQQGLAEDSLNRNSALYQQGIQNQLSAAQQNAQIQSVGAAGLGQQTAMQQNYNSQLSQLGQVYQDYAQGNINQDYNNWYQANGGYQQTQLNNYGQALAAINGGFSTSATTGANPAYQARTAGGALASAGSGALAGAAVGGPWGAAIGGVIGGASYYL